MTTRKRTATKRTATRRATTRRASTTRTGARRTGARRTTSTAYRRRRARPKVATTVGAALGTLVVALLLDASWPVRLGLVAVALLLAGGYLFLQGRRAPAGSPQDPETTPPAKPPAPTAPATETPEDPTA